MRLLPTILAASLATTGLAADLEPPTQLRVEIDGKAYTTTAGATVEVDLDGRKARLRVEELPWRRFSQERLQFDYPRHFPWASDPSTPRSWTLDGNDALIMVVDNQAPRRKPGAVAEAIEQAIAPGKRPRRTTTVLSTEKGGTLTGIRSMLELAGNGFSNEVFALEREDSAWLLVLQDSLGEDGGHSREYVEMRERLAATLEF